MAFGAAIKKKSLGLPRYVGSKESLPIEFSPSDLREYRMKTKIRGRVANMSTALLPQDTARFPPLYM